MGRLFHRSLGLELAGVKKHRSAVAVLDYYPKTERLVLLDIERKEIDINSDTELVASLKDLRRGSPHFEGLAVHGPLSLPPYLKDPNKKAPLDVSKSRDKEVVWMGEFCKSSGEFEKGRSFSPYLQRPAELWLRSLFRGKVPVPDGLGSNSAPLAARLNVLKPYLPAPLVEVLPRASVQRIAGTLVCPRWIADDYSDVENGTAAREEFIAHLVKRAPQVFVYDKDLEHMVLHIAYFNAFVSALTLFLHSRGFCERPPRNYPTTATWIYIPRKVIDWDNLFSAR